MVSNRVYRAGKPYAAAAAELELHAGRQFDPAVVAAFKRIPPSEWEELRARSLQRQRPERIPVLSPMEAYASAASSPVATSSPNGKLTPPSAPSRINRRRSDARALRRSHRHA
jgi:hypothetical protein